MPLSSGSRRTTSAPMITTAGSPLRTATHVAFDPFTPDTLRRLGISNVALSLDRLVVGPCRRDPAEHARARLAWSPATEGLDQLGSQQFRWEAPVVLWVSASIIERINLWRACAWLRDGGLTNQDVLVLDFDALPRQRTPKEPLPPFDCTASVSDHPDDVLLQRLSAAQPWPSPRFDRAVSLWEEFVDSDPTSFVQSCLQGAPGFSELGPLWAFLSGLFPRAVDDRTLRLSRLDQALFAILSETWLTSIAMVAHKSEAGVELRQWLSCTGDLFVDERLDHWARHGSGAVERAPNPSSKVGVSSSVYRLTDTGKRLRDVGLSHLADAPPLPIGGIEAYAPASPWVVLPSKSSLSLRAASAPY